VGNSSGGDTPKNGVTAVCCSNDCKRLLSGGADGMVRVWAVAKETQVMIASIKEPHISPTSPLYLPYISLHLPTR